MTTRRHFIGGALAVAAVIGLAAGPARAEASRVIPVREDVALVQDDNNQWGGNSADMTHQCDTSYQAKKILDLTAVPEAAWAAVREMRLGVFFCVRDYSPVALGAANGLDEAFDIVVNGQVHTFPDKGGMPVFAEGKAVTMDWHDFALPKAEFVRGRNEIVFRKAAGAKKKQDDYFYLGIDNTARADHSAVSLDGGRTWSTDKVNSIGARGEYMVRLHLLSGERQAEVVWRPAASPALSDPAGVTDYAGCHDGTTRLEWAKQSFDPAQALTAVIETTSTVPFVVRWLDAAGAQLPPIRGVGPRFETTLAHQPAGGIVVTGAVVHALAVRGGRGYHVAEPALNICPAIAAPAGLAKKRSATCRVEKDGVILENSGLRCRFAAGRRLQWVSLFNELTGSEVVRDPAQLALFLVEIGTNRYSGTADFACRALHQEGPKGFRADLVLPAPALAATLTGTMDDEGLRLALVLNNRGPVPLDFKVAFPHLAGLALSKNPAADYYFFPHGGGIIADRPATIREGYGDHQALYQLMDLFSPALGAGLALRAEDTDGRYKILALRKTVPGQGAGPTLAPTALVRPEFTWSNTLGAVAGTSLAVEYLRRTRAPGAEFAPAPVLLAAHTGDWRGPMRSYAAWAHRAWPFRPPSRLGGIVNMIAVGWGHDLLFKDGHYRTDFLRPGRDCVELMSWWDWSPLGPWRTPFEKLPEVIGAAATKRWAPYFVTDPVTGRTMWNNQPGDYAGYNERFGGLPAFRQAVAGYEHSGALVTLYTDPFRMDDGSQIGQLHGKEWAVLKADGEYARGYDVWNPCHDLAAVRQWTAAAMERVLRETGADGIRLDEYGHRGWACYNPAHQHTFAETGCAEWQRATAEATKLIRANMDRLDRRLVLTTEHPGYDFLMQYLEGCITYDLTVQASPLRPLECNLQRFFFPECKAFELDQHGADKDFHKRFWNLVGAFGAEYPPAMYAVLKGYADVLAGGDCEPLVPTLRPLVYANRFGSGSRTLWTLYNATGHTVDGPVLEVALAPGQRLVELLSGADLSAGTGDRRTIRLFLPRGGVACVARLDAGQGR